MSEFDAIRPYYDHEVPQVLTQLVASRACSGSQSVGFAVGLAMLP